MGDLSRSRNNQHHLWSKMEVNLATLLLFLSLLYLSQANPTEDDSKHHLADSPADQIGANQPANPMAANHAGHQLKKRDAGRERKASCEGKRCRKKKSPKKAGKEG